jgi:hypothetical protein
MIFRLCFFVAASLLAAGQSARVSLGNSLQQWKLEIEKASGSKVIITRVYFDSSSNELALPDDAEERDVLRRYLLQPAFRSQLVLAHALTINHQGEDGKLHFILLNMGLAGQWAGAEQALLAHELGHVWLDEKGYRSPTYAAADRSCVAIHTGDIVQHILIRDEMHRRAISHREYWLRNLRTATESLEKGAAPLNSCQKLIQLTQWLDVRLGLSSQDWDGFDRFQELCRKNYPELAGYAESIETFLRERDVSQPAEFAAALRFVGDKLEQLYDRGR